MNRAPHPRPVRGLLHLVAATGLALALTACEDDGPDAYGNFESDEVTVSAEATGTLVAFHLLEGATVSRGDAVGQVDTVPLALQLRELESQALLVRTRQDEAAANVRALEAQLAVAVEDRDRARRLYEREVATSAELSRLEGSVTSLREQVAAARVRVRVVRQEESSVEARIAQFQDRLGRATVRNPVDGVVLATFVEAGEFVQQGRPLYTVASLDTLTLRAYVSGGQLARLTLHGPVSVQFDGGTGSLTRLQGRLIWISPTAEFTPTPIQTREERVDQVYAVKVAVPNPDGRLKIGMPGELILPGPDEAGQG